MATIFTPLRYPGGKSSLAPLLAGVIRANGYEGKPYAEPFAGGAGAGIKLLYAGVVSKLHLNDANPAIQDFWRAVLTHTDEFLAMLSDRPVTVREWRRQKEIATQPRAHGVVERGFATFFLNRVNRSGILDGSPIGGLRQDGPYLIDARYNKLMLRKRIERLAQWKSKIRLYRLDALDFLERVTKLEPSPFVYLDPPYVQQGRHLYLNAFNEEQHSKLAAWLKRAEIGWILTYDDHSLIRGLYSDQSIIETSLRYSAQIKREATELLIAPPSLVIPEGPIPGLRYAACA